MSQSVTAPSYSLHKQSSQAIVTLTERAAGATMKRR
jgi:hypothetical protein